MNVLCKKLLCLTEINTSYELDKHIGMTKVELNKHSGLHKSKADCLLQMVLRLSPWGQVLYMAIGATVVVITLLVLACFVGPGCWGYEWVHRGKCFTVLTLVLLMWRI
jgi:hypothetical protein